VDVLIRQGIQLVVTIVLARLLTPADFGAVALMTLFTGVAITLAEGGFTTVLVQRTTLTHDDETTAFWLNSCIALGMSALLALAGPVIADLYDSPMLTLLSVVLGLNIVLASLGTVPAALLQRQLDFRTMAVASATASILSGAAAVALALSGAGVWALATQIVVMSGVATAMLWLLTGWRPRGTMNRDSSLSLLTSGGYVVLANLLDVVFSRSYTVVVGRGYGIREVGFYSRAEQTQQLPVQMLSIIFGRVALPVFSRAGADPDSLRNGARRAVRSLMLINVPVMLGLAVTAAPVIALLLGDGWEPTAPLFSILCLAGLLWPLHVVNLQLLIAQGHLRLYLGLEVTKKVVGICLLVIGAQFGLEGIAWSQVVFGITAFFANAHYTRRFIGYGPIRQLRDVAPVVAISGPLACASVVVARNWSGNSALEMVAILGGGSLVYLTLAQVFRLRALSDIRSALSAARQKEAA
jgi:teichuronic acid exporter